MGSGVISHANNVIKLADHAARPQHGQAARLPRDNRFGKAAGVESGEIATRDATYRKEAGATPPALPPSLVATIAGCPRIRIDNRDTYLLGNIGIAWRDAIGWRWAASIGAPAHDIWNVAFVEALDARANTF
jgi:hypothetical protein